MLESKWARGQPEQQKPIVSKWNTPLQNSTKPEKPQKPEKPLHSNDSHKPSKGALKSLPTPPLSAGKDQPHNRRRHSRRRRSSTKDGSGLAESFASKVSVDDKPHEDNKTAVHDDGAESDESAELAPMTPAAQSLASRIGVPSQAPKPKEQKEQKDQKRRAEPNGRGTQEKLTYLTPKQKIELKKQEEQRKIDEENKKRDAQLQKEVQAMFDQMDDKSTNWADIEE